MDTMLECGCSKNKIGVSPERELLWQGDLYYKSKKISVKANKLLGANENYLQKEFNEVINLYGRVHPENLHNYLRSLMVKSKNEIEVVDIQTNSVKNKLYYSFINYLILKNSFGVVQCNKFVKNFYIVPVKINAIVPKIFKLFYKSGKLVKFKPKDKIKKFNVNNLGQKNKLEKYFEDLKSNTMVGIIVYRQSMKQDLSQDFIKQKSKILHTNSVQVGLNKNEMVNKCCIVKEARLILSNRDPRLNK